MNILRTDLFLVALATQIYCMPGIACVEFSDSYHCISGQASDGYDITLEHQADATGKAYLILKNSASGSEQFQLIADGKEVQLDGSASHALYRSATCDSSSLTVSQREVASAGSSVSRATSQQLFSLYAQGKLLHVVTTATVQNDGMNPVTSSDEIFCARR